jgi:pimeloyl-ACP methyl ester carboxylesterase
LLGSGYLPLDDDKLRRIQIPALLINGQHSPSLFHRLMDRLEQLLPRAGRIEIPGASHIVHEDNSTAYNAAVLSFLDRHRKANPQPDPVGMRPDHSQLRDKPLASIRL